MPLLSRLLCHSPRRGEEGVALVMTLWVLTALAAMMVPLAVGARQSGLRTLRAVEDVTLRAATDAAGARALAELAAGRAVLGSERHWKLGAVELRYTITGESGRVDLNAASPEVLDSLFAAHGLRGPAATALRDRLLDWRDGDELRHLHGAERADYAATGVTDLPADGPLRHPSELRRVITADGAVDAGLYAPLWDDVTVWTAAPRPVPRLAGHRLRQQLAGAGEKPVAEGDGPVVAEIGDADPAGVYRVDIRVALPSGAARRTVMVIAQEKGDWRIREWMTPLPFGDRRDE